MNHASLFSGIGGPEVAAAFLGWRNVFHCEINPFGRKVLEYWFPESVSYDDITKTDFRKWRGHIDVLTGGFPCQPFSYAGKRGGYKDDRYLWPEMFRAVSEIRPTWVVGENVAGITTMVEGGILTDLGCEATLFDEGDSVHRYRLQESYTIERICKDFEAIGYEVQPILIPAAAVGAPHRRDRVFFLAHYDAQDPDDLRREDDTTDIGSKNQQHRHVSSGDSQRLRTEAGLDVADSRNAGTQGQRKRKAEVHSPGSAANSHSKGRRQVDKHLQSELADGAEPFGLGREWPSSDIDCKGLQKSKQSRRSEDSTEGSRRVHHRAVGPCQYRPASHAFRERLSASVQSRCYGSQEWYDEERPVEYASNDAWLEGAWWNHFPTVSPVHTRDDGLSKIMDGTTLGFHKWRNESIKAYGNAIVPQVMFRIFQAIESIQNENNNY